MACADVDIKWYSIILTYQTIRTVNHYKLFPSNKIPLGSSHSY